MNLVDQIFEQAKLGTAPDVNANPFLEGRRVGIAQQHADIAKQQLAMEMAQLPLHMTIQQQNADMNALKIQDGLRARQNLIDTETAFSGLADTVHHAMTDAAPVDVNPFFFEAVAKHPRLAETERFQTLWKDYNTSLNAKLALQEAKNAAKAQEFTPGFGTAVNPITGQPEAYWRQSPNNAPLVKPDKETPSTAQKNFKDLKTYQQALSDAMASGDPVRIAAAKRDLDTFGAMVTPPTQTVYDPKTGQPIFTSGKQIGDLTVATRTKMQEQEFSDSEALRTLGEAIGGIEANPTAIGVRGVVGQAVEKARGQINPNEPLSTPITDTRQKASIAFSRVAPALRVDSGNMSKYELNKLEQAGDVLDPTEAPQTALNKLRNLQAVVVARQLRVLKAQGKPVDDVTLRAIRGEEIAGLLQSGLLSQEDALRLYRIHKNAR